MTFPDLKGYYQKYPHRSLDLDVIRGIAIVLMLLFHFCFDLNHFGFINIDIYNQHGTFWKQFRYVIVVLFLLCVGISLYLANRNGLNPRRILKRSALLLVSAVAISVASYFFFPHSWIYFGVIHFIFVASLLGLLFLRIPIIAAIVGITLLVLDYTGTLGRMWMFDPIYHLLPHRTEDLVPLTPWFGWVLLGIFAGRYGLYRLHIPNLALTRYLALFGRHSLLIYLAHQPLFFGGTMAAYKLFS